MLLVNLRRVVHHAQLLESGEDGLLVEVVQLAPVQDQVLGGEQLSLPQQDGQNTS